MSLEVIEEKAKLHKTLLTETNEISAVIRKKITESTDPYIEGLRTKIEAITLLEEQIKQELTANKDLFKKPKTKVIHGLKLGFRKGKGKLIINDEDALIKKLKRDYHDDIGALVKKTETIVKSGIEKLDARELKRLGVTIENASDEVVFSIVEDSIDDLLNFVFEMQE